VKAVEAAAIVVVSPNHANATLGTVIGQMRATPDTWNLCLSEDARMKHLNNLSLTSIDVVIALMDLLCHNQTDRHADPAVVPPRPITQEQAELAVHLALVLTFAFENAIQEAP
jgi:hypothetical protein